MFHEPLMDTPVGKLTLRQIAILVIFGVLAYGVARTQPPSDPMSMVMAGGLTFLPGLFLAFKKVKTISPEAHLAMLLFGFGRGFGPRPGTAKRGRRIKGKTLVPVEESQPIQVPQHVEVEVGAAGGEKPVVISGLLRNPRTGEVMPATPFTVYVDGRRYQDGFTDEHGTFTIYFTPQHLGVHTVELLPEGYAGEPFRLEVDVKLSGRVRIRGPEGAA